MKIKSEDVSIHKIRSDTIRTLLRQCFSMIIGLGSSVLLARLLGPIGNGQYAIGILLTTTLATFMNFGVETANSYFIASKKSDLYSAFKINLLLWSILSIIGTIIATSIILVQSKNWFPDVPIDFLLLGTFIFPVSLLQIFLRSFFEGLQDFKKYNSVLLISPCIILITAPILIKLLNLGVLGGLLAYTMGELVGCLITLNILWPYVYKEKYKNKHMMKYLKKYVVYGWKTYIGDILVFLTYRADTFIINLFLNPAATGYYIIAVQIAERLWILSRSVSTVLFPTLSQLQHDEAKKQFLTAFIARWMLLFSIIGAIMLAILVTPFIKIFYGNDYIPTINPLLWLLPGIAIGSMSRIISNDISSRGKPEINSYISMVAVIINIGANIFLIPQYGIEGAAMVSSVTYSLDALLKIWVYSRLSGSPWWNVIKFNSDDWSLILQGYHELRNMLKRDLRVLRESQT